MEIEKDDNYDDANDDDEDEYKKGNKTMKKLLLQRKHEVAIFKNKYSVHPTSLLTDS